ncbi:MAG: MMPL family transporter [Clostridiales bacterium]|nr:MMPL family transporter [Clostridiales bacterium]
MLDWLARWVVRNRILIVALSALLLIPSVYGMSRTKTNYDILAYLPESLPSVQGQKILNDTFGYGATALLLLRDTSDGEAENLKKRLEQVKGVAAVTWISDLADLAIPKEFLPADLVDQFYSGDSTLMQIQFEEEASSLQTEKAVQQIKGELEDLFGPRAYLAGTPPMLAELRAQVEKEMPLYSVAAILLTLTLLVFTLPSFLLPLLILLSIGVAIVYNLGLSYWLNQSMSYITAAVAGALQLGVTMDFSIFLVHRYGEERQQKDKEEAMADAIRFTAQAILTSAATAMAGFLAMTTMALGIGGDLGGTMARGVFISVVMILTLLPSLILILEPWVERVRHRPLLPRFARLAPWIARHPRPLFLLFLLLFLPALLGYSSVDVVYDINRLMPQSLPSVRNLAVIQEQFPTTESAFLVMDSTLSPWDREEVQKKIEALPGVTRVMGLENLADPAVPDPFIPDHVKDMFTKDGYHLAMIQLAYGAYDEGMTRMIREAEAVLRPYAGHAFFTGQPVLENDLMAVVREDSRRVDLVSVAAIFAIILVAFRSLALPILLVGAIELAILFNLGLDFYLGRSMPFVGTFAIGAIQLGSTINYALLLVTRFREELQRQGGQNPGEAMVRAIRTSGGAIVTSALALSGAVVGIWITTDIPVLSDLTFMIARGALISLAVILFLLPAVLLTLQGFIAQTTWNWPKPASRMAKEQEGSAAR